MLRIVDLTKTFDANRALDSVSFEINRGECLALVGESGSGKTTLARCLLRLQPATSGQIFYDDINLLALSEREFRRLRPKFQMVFQQAGQALNPRHRVRTALAEALSIRHDQTPKSISEEITQLLEAVGLALDIAARFPHELSGGQQQRVGLARALAAEPELLVADEPTSSLDVSLRRQILRLFRKLQQQRGLTLLLISHDLALTHEIADRVAVLYRGKIVELAPTKILVQAAAHPYSQILLSAGSLQCGDHVAAALTRSMHFKSKLETSARRNAASASNQSCAFKHRCPMAEEICFQRTPELTPAADGHLVACHLANGSDTAKPVTVVKEEQPSLLQKARTC